MDRASQIESIARRLEAIEDDLHQMEDMDEYRERVTDVRSGLVQDALLDLLEDAEQGEVMLFDEAGNRTRRLGKADKGLREAAEHLDEDE